MLGATGHASATEPDVGRGSMRLRDGAPFSAIVFVAARVTLSLVAVLTVGSVHPPSSASSGMAVPATAGWHNAIDGTNRWDAGWFERIARDGYSPVDASAAFFPGYPLAIRGVTTVTPLAESDAALVVSNLAFLAALTVLFVLTAFEFSQPVARRTVLLVAFFPASFFFLAPYSESLFLLGSVLTFWWARRGRWGLAAAGGFVAALTRSLGLLLVPALLLEAWSIDRDQRPRAILASLAPLLAPAAYAAYWFARTGDALRPFHAQDSWFRSLELPIVTLGNGLWLGISGVADRHGIYWTVDVVLTAVVLIALALGWNRIPRPYLVYVLLSLAVILSYPLPERPLLSVPRFVAVLFPAFWAMAALTRGWRFRVLLGAFGLGYVLLSVAFMNWGYIF
jgi:Mannosyltransferase (PIG-V)